MTTAHNDLDLATGQRRHQAYATLAAQIELLGYMLIKGVSPIDGQGLYYAMRWGAAKPLANLKEAARYLAVLLGAGDGGG